MDIAERFRPLEGRWIFRRDTGSPVDLRLNTMPTLFGEDLTCRILDRDKGLRPLDDLNLGHGVTQDLLSLLKHPSGLILVTGPTGSGKTTTLYGCLQHLHDGRRKINTLEDPVEYVLEGVRQAQINPRMGSDFPILLSACMRQAPDIIMIGEIRDGRTAQIAVRAANSGHLVLATLHAPLAAAAAYNLMALGVNAHFLASGLLGILSQRLLRHLCSRCRASIDVSDCPSLFDDVRELLPPDSVDTMYAPVGCDACYQQGYDKLICVCEVMTLNEPLRRMIVEGQPMHRLHQEAIRNRMVDLRRAALLRIASGETTTEEMFRQIPFEYFDAAEEV
jgi:type II secretory ATPase GspE/PulE/Tfp pilus assembly ATPase PilB-like protein